MATPYDVWREGVPLADALARYAGGAAWAAEQARVTAAFDRLRTDPRSPLIDRPETAARLQQMAGEWERQMQDLRRLREDLVGMLGRSELFAVGFAGAAAGDCAETLQPLPPAVWRADAAIDWDRSRLAVGSLRYADIRILDGRRAIPDRGAGDAPGIGAQASANLDEKR